MNPRTDRDTRRHNLHLLDYNACLRTSTEVPELAPSTVIPARLVAFNEAKATRDPDAGIHFYLDDYRFEWAWSDPLKYVDMLRRFTCVLTPDFSLWVDMPEPLQRYQVYRSRVVGWIWQQHGVEIVPTLTWGFPESYEFAFDGIPEGGTVSLSTVGLTRGRDAQELLTRGAEEAMVRLCPSVVLAYGQPMDFDSGGAQVVWYESSMATRFEEIKTGTNHEQNAIKKSKRKQTKANLTKT
jgi:hypothetical protein